MLRPAAHAGAGAGALASLLRTCCAGRLLVRGVTPPTAAPAGAGALLRTCCAGGLLVRGVTPPAAGRGFLAEDVDGYGDYQSRTRFPAGDTLWFPDILEQSLADLAKFSVRLKMSVASNPAMMQPTEGVPSNIQNGGLSIRRACSGSARTIGSLLLNEQ